MNSLRTPLWSSFYNHCSPFLKNEEGGVAIIAGLSIVPLMLITGLAVETARISHGNSRAVYAAKTAAASATRYKGAEAEDVALKVAQSNLIKGASSSFDLSGANVQYQDDGTTITVSITGTIPAFLGQLAGVTEYNINATESAVRVLQEGLELALVVETSPLMTSGQLNAIKNGATNFITTLYGTEEQLPNVAVSIIPYTTGLDFYSTANISSRLWTPLVNEQAYLLDVASNFTDDPVGEVQFVEPLFTTRLDEIRTDGLILTETATTVFTEDGIYQKSDQKFLPISPVAHLTTAFEVLRPESPWTGEVTATDSIPPKIFNHPLNRKVVVIMAATDAFWGDGTEDLCSKLKGEDASAASLDAPSRPNIEIYTVSLPGISPATQTRLEACSSGVDYVYVAGTDAEASQNMTEISESLVPEGARP